MIRAEKLEEVWLMVSPQNPLKRQTDLLDDDLRLQMAQQALADDPSIHVSDYEFHLPKPSYTWDTLQALSRDYPDRSFTLIIGADNWERFGNWYAHDQILANYDIVIYPRKGSRIRKSSLPPNVRLLRMPLINVSGTEIRQRMAEGLPIDDLVPARVAEMLTQDRQK